MTREVCFKLYLFNAQRIRFRCKGKELLNKMSKKAGNASYVFSIDQEKKSKWPALVKVASRLHKDAITCVTIP